MSRIAWHAARCDAPCEPTPAHALAMPAELLSTVTRNDQREKDLQDLFVSWNRTPPLRAAIAGRPRSISFAADPDREWGHAAWGYHPRVDIVGDTSDGRRLVIELKLGTKYEPLGLAEVLFHAERLTHPERRVRPVLVTQYNLWNRIVIRALHRRSHEPFVDYYEVGVVDLGGAPCFWFDAPLAAWEPMPRPGEAIVALTSRVASDAPDAAWLQGTLHWYKVDETGTYFATPVPCDQRPPVMEVPYLMAAPVEDGASRWLAWAGIPPTLDAATARWSMDRYWIYAA